MEYPEIRALCDRVVEAGLGKPTEKNKAILREGAQHIDNLLDTRALLLKKSSKEEPYVRPETPFMKGLKLLEDLYCDEFYAPIFEERLRRYAKSLRANRPVPHETLEFFVEYENGCLFCH